MSLDKIGLFYEENARKKAPKLKPMPFIPETGWRPPNTFPNLERATLIGLDTETYDPELKEFGPGWARGKGHIVGVSLAAIDKQGNSGKWYFPIRHETDPHMNMDPQHVLNYLKYALGNPYQDKVGANIQYDIGWLRHEGVNVAGRLYDVQYAEALLNESAKVGLEILGQKYLSEGKESPLLYEWLADWFGGKPDGSQREHISKAPPSLVGPYAESDADLPIRLLRTMYPLIVEEGLLNVFTMECELIRLIVDMRFAGVTVDLNKAEQLREKLMQQEKILTDNLANDIGFAVNVNSAVNLANVFDQLNLPYLYTEKGNPSFKKEFLESVDHPIAETILEIRKLAKLRGTFIESYILDANVNGKVFGQFHQLRGEKGGTRSGRFSSSTPNLQNIPSRDKILAPLIRGLFIPDPDHVQWRTFDYSQIEYRFLVHFAIGEAGEAIRAHFRAHPDTDYHVYAQEVVKAATGVLIDRKPIKNINFGLIYGMGVKTLAQTLKMSIAEASKLMDVYFQGVPFAKPTMEYYMAMAQRTGVVATILGRKSRFDLWEPIAWDDTRPPLPYYDAIRYYGSRIQRASTHKALNRGLQGSAAELMKMAMWYCYRAGIFDATGVPRLTVHDELGFSDPGTRIANEAFIECRHLMETCMPQILIPVKTDMEIGPDWGHVQEVA